MIEDRPRVESVISQAVLDKDRKHVGDLFAVRVWGESSLASADRASMISVMIQPALRFLPHRELVCPIINAENERQRSEVASVEPGSMPPSTTEFAPRWENGTHQIRAMFGRRILRNWRN
jgi:hypothetical protein